jgi:hypothetical protein
VRNHFTVFDARESMYRALTLQAAAADGTIKPIFDPNTTAEYDAGLFANMETIRLQYWATTFRAVNDGVTDSGTH